MVRLRKRLRLSVPPAELLSCLNRTPVTLLRALHPGLAASLLAQADDLAGCLELTVSDSQQAL